MGESMDDYQENPGRWLVNRLVESFMKLVPRRLPVTRISVRDLATNTSAVLREMRSHPKAAVVTYRGRVSFLLIPLDPNEADPLILSAQPSVRERIARSNADLAARLEGSDVPDCPECGAKMQLAGGAYVCTGCGRATGAA